MAATSSQSVPRSSALNMHRSASTILRFQLAAWTSIKAKSAVCGECVACSADDVLFFVFLLWQMQSYNLQSEAAAQIEERWVVRVGSPKDSTA